MSKLENDANAPVRMTGGILTYIKQSFTVMRNESVKFLRGKKLLLFTVLIAVVLALITFLPYLLDGELPDNIPTTSGLYISFISIIVLLFATLFSSTSLVSEFEERTALILFTRPVKKSSIMLGKILASMIIGIVFIGVYYLITGIVTTVVAGGVDENLFTSFGLAVLYLFCMSGIALLISSLVKKGSTAAILTFMTPLLIFSIVSSILVIYGFETWWMPNDASGAIYSVFDIPAESQSADPNVLQSAGVLGAWGLVTMLIAYLLFKRRDF